MMPRKSRLASRIKEETMRVRWKEVVAQCHQLYVMEMFTHPDDPEGTNYKERSPVRETSTYSVYIAACAMTTGELC